MKQKHWITTLTFILATTLSAAVCATSVSIKKNNQEFTVSLISYNKEIYTLAYKTFLMNRNLEAAYVVAKAAVQQKPGDTMWREHYAQIASWTNRPNAALQQWLYLAKNRHDPKSINSAIQIATMLHKHTLLAELFRLKIKYGDEKASAWGGYIAAKEALGKPQEAIQELRAIIEKEPTLNHFKRLATLYRSMGNREGELKTLNMIEKKFGVIPSLAIRQAELLYSEGKIQRAHEELTSAATIAKDTNYTFWHAYGKLAWMIQDYKNAELAYQKLNKTKHINSDELVNFIQMTEREDKKLAYTLATQGWNKYHVDFFLLKILDFTPPLKKWTQLQQILIAAPPDMTARLNRLPYFISIKAQMLIYFNKKNEALRLYKTTVKTMPDTPILKIDYLWFLINNKFYLPLQQALIEWRDYPAQDEIFTPPFVAGYILLKKPQLALNLLNQQYRTKQNDPQWLFTVAAALEQGNQKRQAITMRKLAWHRLLTSLKKQGVLLKSKKSINEFARIATYHAPGEMLSNTILKLSKHAPSHEESNRQLMILALRLNQYQLADYYWQHYGKTQDIEAWMRQSIALRNNDRNQLQKLLDKDLDQLPHRDRVFAAKRTGNELLAQTLAYQGLVEHPADSEMHQIMQNTQLGATNRISIVPEYQQIGYIRGPKTKLNARYFITPSLSLSPWANFWDTRSKNKAKLKPATGLDRDFGIQVNNRYQHSIINFNIGYRNALTHFMTSMIQNTHRWSSKLTSILVLGYNQKARDTTPLLIAGMKNEARLALLYRSTQRNTITGSAAYKRFNSQDSAHLGNGQVYDIQYSYKFEFGYPDWNTNLFASIHRYQHSGKLSKDARKIIPAGQTADLFFYIPRNFVRYGASFGFGQTYQTEYTDALRPFAEVSIFNNNRFGLGGYFDGGLAGHLFGHDHWALYYRRGVNIEESGQLDYIFGLNYQMFF